MKVKVILFGILSALLVDVFGCRGESRQRKAVQPTPYHAKKITALPDPEREILGNFCADHQNASTQLRDFFKGYLQLKNLINDYPLDMKVLDFCQQVHEGEGHPVFRPLCVSVQNQRETESLTIREYLEREQRFLEVLKNHAPDWTGGYRTDIPETNDGTRMSLADFCRTLGF
jgi:hypothetical protein